MQNLQQNRALNKEAAQMQASGNGRRKGLYGRERPPTLPDPVFDDRAPVVLASGAHGPADKIRTSEFERGAKHRVAVWYGPKPSFDWPFIPEGREIRTRQGGRRPVVSSARQAPYPTQSGKKRTEMGPGGSLFTQIFEGGI